LHKINSYKYNYKDSNISPKFFLFLIFIDSIFVSYIITNSISLLYSFIFALLVICYTYFIINIENNNIYLIHDYNKFRYPIKTLKKNFGTIQILLIFSMIFEVIITCFYFILGDILFFLVLLFADFLKDITLSKTLEQTGNSNWNIIIGVEWATTRTIMILIFIFYGYIYIWMYIIIITYIILVIITIIDVDLLNLRALIPDAYYVIITMGSKDYIIFIAVLIPILIHLYYYIFKN